MRIVVALLALGSATGVCAQQSPPQWGSTVVEKQPTIKVIDAKNVIVDDVRWRLKGYSAPLIEGAKCVDERVRGLRASSRLEGLLASARVEVAIFPEGRWDQWLRQARLTIDGKDVGPILIDEQLAVREGIRERWGCPEPKPTKPAVKPPPKPAVVKETTVVKEKTVVIKEKTVVVVIKEKAAGPKCVWVGGYTRSDGTKVKGYQRCTKA